ncbi:hypothetical protein RR48_00898 [Papilio machaon]|uniref:Uncharacterized protein n=1 Tax=Papilio machaon TaxID=76193 RepID=A0A0N1PH70_PAPMA|nr:hypothetical protein RR48_00898 [Papilio machaon]
MSTRAARRSSLVPPPPPARDLDILLAFLSHISVRYKKVLVQCQQECARSVQSQRRVHVSRRAVSSRLFDRSRRHWLRPHLHVVAARADIYLCN